MKTFVLVASCAVVAVAGACSSTGPSRDAVGSASTTGGGVWANDDFSGRQTWYTTTQGSELIEYPIFMNLETVASAPAAGTNASAEDGGSDEGGDDGSGAASAGDDGGAGGGGANAAQPATGIQLFSDPANLASFGFLYPPAGVSNLTMDNLPFGVLKDTDAVSNIDYLGLTCAACHTGILNVRGAGQVLIDGGQGFVQMQEFLSGVDQALTATLMDGAKLARLCANIGDADPVECGNRVQAAESRTAGILARNVVSDTEGPGRLDAITRILNDVFAPTTNDSLGGELGGETPVTLAAPVSIPFLWDAPILRCTQTDCLATGPLTRNVGEVLGVFGHSYMNVNTDGSVSVTGSPRIANLVALEESLKTMKSPRWADNTSILGTLDSAAVARGSALYTSNCASCHAEPYLDNPPASAFVSETVGGTTNQFWNVTTMPYGDVGTDPNFILMDGSRMVTDPNLATLFSQAVQAKGVAGFLFTSAALKFQGLESLDGSSVNALLMLGAVTASLENDYVQAYGITPDQVNAMDNYRAPASSVQLAVYRARPLDGIAFTAPFGHNGAWPTLAFVLQDPLIRPKSFVIRPGSFDPVNVGLDTAPAGTYPDDPSDLFVLDTSQDGNSNQGHTYGTGMSNADKQDLLEYLKSL